MRVCIASLVLLGLIALPRPLAAQAAPDWTITAHLGVAGFGDAAEDTASADAFSARPGGAMQYGLELARRLGTWQLGLDLSYTPSHVQVRGAGVLVEARSETMQRIRAALLLSRPVVPVGRGAVWLGAGPSIDRWSLDGNDARSRLGAEAQLGLRLPAGGVTFENVLRLGWSDGPFDAEDLPDGYRTGGLWTMGMRAGIRIGL